MAACVPELLAPAGDWEALRAAVANGADAVYFGLEDFNARRRAANFQRAELPDVVAYLHDRNVRGYVTLNTLVFPDELPRAAEFLGTIADAGTDAVIIQDLGLVRLIRRLVPTLPIHASTQMTQTEAEGTELLASLGVRRVIVARELALAELARLRAATTVPLEVFVHGALCISYSGQCLASEVFWGRSANRGECGQACRLPYTLVADGQPRPHAERPYPLSAQDLAAWERVRDLVRLGMAALKIEGRLKSAHYVAAATRMYRAALDAATRGEAFVPAPELQSDLLQSFSRGTTHGYLDGVNHPALVHGRFPHKRGLCVGKVVGTAARGTIVELGAGGTLKPGDGVVFDAGHPDRDEQGGRVYGVEATPNPRRVLLTFGRGDLNLVAIAAGSEVWKSDDPAVRRRLESTYARDRTMRRVRVDAEVEVRADRTLTVVLCDADGHAATGTWPQPLAAAQKHPLTTALLRDQLARLGDTPFELGTVTLRGSTGPTDAVPVMVPKSVLNELRRQLAVELRQQRAVGARHAVSDPEALAALRAAPPCETSDTTPSLAVLVRNLAQLTAALEWQRGAESFRAEAPRIYCDFRPQGDYARAVELARQAGVAVALATPHVLMPGELTELDRLAELRPDGVLVRSLGALHYLRRNWPHLALSGDFTLNAANDLAAALLLELGLKRVTPSVELDREQWRALAARVAPQRLEFVLHHHPPLFHTRYCLYMAHSSGGTRCGDCGWPCQSHAVELRDRNGVAHPVLVDGLGRNTVHHGEPRVRTAWVAELLRLGVRHFRVELLRETPDDVFRRLDAGVRALAV